LFGPSYWIIEPERLESQKRGVGRHPHEKKFNNDYLCIGLELLKAFFLTTKWTGKEPFRPGGRVVTTKCEVDTGPNCRFQLGSGSLCQVSAVSRKEEGSVTRWRESSKLKIDAFFPLEKIDPLSRKS
jgi:hypothetical protein